MLLDQRYLRLHCQLDVGKCAGTGARRDTRQDPGRTLLVHQPTGAVDRIHDDHPACCATLSALGHADLAARQTLGHQDHRSALCGHRPSNLFDKDMFRHAVDGIERVPLFLPRHAGKRGDCRLFTRPHDVPSDSAMQGLDGREERMDGSCCHGSIRSTSSGNAGRRRRRAPRPFLPATCH